MSIIIPVYDQEPNIAVLMERLFHVLCTLSQPFEVIAIDDGSPRLCCALH
ncbi:MAG: glycosyltransferase [Vicinamibacterales bacterium]